MLPILRPIQVLLIVLMSFVAKGSNSELNVAFSGHASLVGFNMKQFLSLSLGFITLTLRKITSQLFCTLPKFDVSFLLDSSYISLAQMPHKRSCVLSHCILSGVTRFRFVPLLVMSILIILLRWCLLGFSTVKLPF